jgi:membrane peptidoglycan carboxypeptidase
MAYNTVPSFTLGSIETSPLSMATSFGTFANRGKRCDPIAIKSITDPYGKEVDTQQANCRQVIPDKVADGANQVLRGAFTFGTAAGRGFPDGRNASGKSGTTDSRKNAWFIGYTPEIVGVAMVSYDPNPYYADFWTGRPSYLQGILTGTGVRLGGSGSEDATRIWRPAMIETVDYLQLPRTGFTAPTGDILSGRSVGIPNTNGMSKEQATRTLQDAGFIVFEKEVFDDTRPKGAFVSVSCEHYYGGTCTMSISQGPRPNPPSKPPGPGTTEPTGGASGSPPPSGNPTENDHSGG